MQLSIFLIACFLTVISFEGQCGPISPIIGSGSYYIQAGFSALTSTQITDFQASNGTVYKKHIINLKYYLATYNLAVGYKKLHWKFETNETQKSIYLYTSSKTPVYFYLTFCSEYGSSLFDLEASYLAVDTYLNNQIYLQNSFQVMQYAGSSYPVNHTMIQIYNSLTWTNYKNTTKMILFTRFYDHNPVLYNNSLGFYIKFTDVSTSTFQFNLLYPFGMVWPIYYFGYIVYFNPDQLLINKNIILNTASLSTLTKNSDQFTAKSMNTTGFYDYTYITGQGCDMINNNTFIALSFYQGFYTQMNFDLSLSSNSVFAAATNYYVFNFTVVHFCSYICATTTNPFMHKVDNMCYDVCPEGYYGNLTTTFCELCQLNCSTCSMTQTNCTSCVNGTVLSGNTCIQSTDLICTGDCFTCNSTSNNCTSCVNNTYLINFACVADCPLGSFKDTANLLCEVCPTNCLNCSSSQCFSCGGLYYLYNGVCNLTCPATTYADSLFHQCLNCTGTCTNCNVSSTNCTSCTNGLFLFNFDCLSDCPLGYWILLNFCAPCPIYCSNCSSPISCYQCKNGSFLYSLTCVLNCPNTTYGDSSINECLNCNGTCYNCIYESTNCTNCINNTFFLNFDCFYNCPAGYYGDLFTGNCQTCFLYCLTCTAINICTQCIASNLLWPNFDKCGTSCPPNYFPNFTTKMCQKIIIQGCLSALYLNGVSICLQCDASQYFKYLSNSKSCVCKDGYKLNNGTCQEYCGDGIVNNMPCDDGNFVNGDGCSSQCLIQNNFNCFSVSNGPNLKSKCTYLPEINLQIISQIKMDGQNTLKLTIKINPVPLSLTSDQIKQFLNMKIENDVVNMSNLQIIYKDGIAQIYIPFTASIQNKELSLSTNFDPTKFSSSNVLISSILKGDNVALLYSSDLTLYKALGTINFSMAIFVCIFALLSSYKHKMIGLELIMPFQVILYSQSFYNLETLQTTVYSSLKPVSFSIFTPDQIGSKNNAWYKIGMTGGFLENYNLLGLIFLISTILLIIRMFKLQNGQRNRFKHKKALRDWLNFGQFKILIRQYQSIIWKYFFVSFCLSTIPLIFSISAKAMTAQPNFYPQTIMNVINNKGNYLFFLLFMGALFYTSIPRIFYNNKKNLLKKHIFKREGEKFKYDASYCMYFQLHYLFIGLIYAYCSSTLPVFYTISAINGLFFLYLVVKRPYQSILDNIGALLSNIIVVYFLSLNLYIKLVGTSPTVNFLSKTSGFVITLLLFIQCIVSIARLIIFWKNDVQQNINGLIRDQKMHKFQYQKDKAFNKFVNGAAKNQEDQFKNMMNQIQDEMILNQPKTINQQLIPKNKKANTSENENTKNSIICQGQQKNQTVPQQKYSSLKRIKNDLKESLKIYKLEQQQRQKKIYGS